MTGRPPVEHHDIEAAVAPTRERVLMRHRRRPRPTPWERSSRQGGDEIGGEIPHEGAQARQRVRRLGAVEIGDDGADLGRDEAARREPPKRLSQRLTPRRVDDVGVALGGLVGANATEERVERLGPEWPMLPGTTLRRDPDRAGGTRHEDRAVDDRIVVAGDGLERVHRCKPTDGARPRAGCFYVQ